MDQDAGFHGFGSYTKSGIVIPCRYKSEGMGFVAQMYLDDDPPIAARLFKSAGTGLA